MPDSIVNAWNKGSVVTFTLQGEWFPTVHIAPLISHEVKNGSTVIQLFCKDGESIDLPMQYRPAEAAITGKP